MSVSASIACAVFELEDAYLDTEKHVSAWPRSNPPRTALCVDHTELTGPALWVRHAGHISALLRPWV